MPWCGSCGQQLFTNTCAACCKAKPVPIEDTTNWPASDRGDLASHEGWEELRCWEIASRCEPPDDTQSLEQRLDWLSKLRTGNISEYEGEKFGKQGVKFWDRVVG